MVKEEFNTKIGEFGEILQKIAGDMASGALHEKLPPAALLEKTESWVNRMTELVISSEEDMLILKPEKTYTVKAKCKNLTQTLTTFKDILLQNTSDPPANSRLAFEQLRKALTDGSDFLLLMREVRDNPSPLMNAVLTFKKASETKASVISIQASEDVQPLIKHVLSRMDEFQVALTSLEKKVAEMRENVRRFQEESLKLLANKISEQHQQSEDKTEKRQLSLSNFKAEQN